MKPRRPKIGCNDPALMLLVRRDAHPPKPRRFYTSSSCLLLLCYLLSSLSSLTSALSIAPRSSSSSRDHNNKNLGSDRGVDTSAVSSSRYFTATLTAPPLVPVVQDDDIEGASSRVIRPRSGGSSFDELHHHHTLHPRTQQSQYQTPLQVVYTNNPHTLALWLSEHVSSNGCTTLGFDTESVPVGAPWISRKLVNFDGPATVQLSTLTSSLVIHLAKRNGKPCQSCGPLLDAILRDDTIIKAGCNIDDDIIDLKQHRWSQLNAVSRLELFGLTSKQYGLKRLTQLILGLELPKPKKLSASDWSRMPLTERQVIYAARDAWAASAIVDALSRIEPSIFESHNLIQHLQSQGSLDDLMRRKDTVAEAKALLKAVLLPHRSTRTSSSSSSSSVAPKTTTSTIPDWKMAMIEDLQSTIQDNRPEKFRLQYVIPPSQQLAGTCSGSWTTSANNNHTSY